MSAAAVEQLERSLVKFSDTTGNQIAVVIVNDLGGLPLEDFSYYLARKWGIGKDKNDNGVLLLIAKAERKARIEVGKGLEGAIPDLLAYEIIRADLAPNLSSGNFDAGVTAAAKSLCNASQHEYKDVRQVKRNDDGGILPLIFLLVLLVFFLMMMRRMQRSKGHYMSRRGYRDFDDRNRGPDIWFFPTGGFGGGGGGGFFDGGGDSGGFGGFGGGDFGGGGASGDW
jgi:uncharacterized protein